MKVLTGTFIAARRAQIAAAEVGESFGRLRLVFRSALVAFLIFFCAAFSQTANAQTFGCTPAKANDIVCENTKTGSPPSNWDISGAGDSTIQGFATDISVPQGGTISFKISTPARAYTITIFRLGYYGGNGARQIASVTPSASLPQTQPACKTDSSTLLYDCGNWGVSASWQVPSNATSGVYVALLKRTDTGGVNHIVFVVRNDSSHSDVLFQTADESWQAYNAYGGNSVYGALDTFDLPNRAFKVSYNRPFITRGFSNESATWLFGNEYPMIRWLEANGYDVTYSTGIDAARNGSLILNHKIYMDCGHDEYVSGPQRTNIEAARNAGVNMAFFSGNEFFWKTRWENSIDGSNTPYRTMVVYKETLAFAKIDPDDPPTWTGTWRDPSFSPPADGGRPENALTGTIFMVNGPATDNPGSLSMEVPSADGKMRFWRNTSVANLGTGQTSTLPTGTLGYEWDEDLDNGARPAGLFDLSTATYNLTTDLLLDYGATYGAGTATHHMTEYRASSGALVFGAGSVQYAWGLDSNHDNSFGFANPAASPDMQQATVNLFADMGVQPATIQSGLLLAQKSTDATPPSSTITSPSSGAVLQRGTPVTVSGTATDFGGGVVGGVEVSTDGGQTWHPATGRQSWTYTFTPLDPGPIQILSRAVDDSGNLESPGSGVTVSIPVPAAGIDAQASGDGVIPSTTVQTPAFSTSAGNELLLAFVATDYTSGANTTVTNVSGAGLTWVLVVRTNTQAGTSEIWRAFAPSALSNATVVATLSETAVASITVTSFTGVDISGTNGSGAIGATASANSAKGAPTASLVTTRNNSWVLGVGNDYDKAVARTPGAGQSLVHQDLSSSGDTYWVQMQNNQFPSSGTTATINDTAPTGDRFNLSIVEVLSPVGGTLFSVSGTVSPSSVGSGTLLTLSGSASASAAADSSGNYSFGNLGNGTYTITPSKAGFTFTPASQTVTVNGGNLTSVNFTASAVPTFSISGAVSPSSIGSGTLLTLSGAANATVTGDASGNYSFTGLANGTYTVTPSKSGFTFSPANQTVTINSSNVTSINFTAATTPTFSISGTLSPSSAGSGAVLTLSGAASTTVTADTSGNFSFAGLLNGTYTITPHKSLFSFTPASQQVTINGGNVSGVNFVVASGQTVFTSQTPAGTNDSDGPGVDYELGTVFTSSIAGQITAIRFWKASNETGTHTGNLWSAAGQLLATVTFTGETTSGWQQQNLTTPVSIAANTNYVVSVNTGNSFYVDTTSGLATSVVNGNLSTPVGSNGVYGSPGAFPASSFQNSNYFRDVLFVAGPTYTLSGTISPAAGGAGATLTLSGAGTATATADSSGNYTFSGLANGAYIVTPSKAGYAFTPTGQSVTINGGNVTGVNFAATAGSTVFTTQTPAVTNGSDGPNVNYELGTVFTSNIAGQITAIRFWKASNESGTHTGHLWSAAGQLLATVTFTGETASGWQQQNLTTPVPIAANTNYVVSVNTGNSFYVDTASGLATSVVNGNLSTPVGSNGVYGSPGAFPASSFQNSNYFRDVLFVAVTTYTASGAVSPAASGAGTTLTLSGAGTATATADSSGNYTFGGLANGTYTVTPSKAGFTFTPASLNFSFRGTNVAGLNFSTATLTYSLTGTITPSTGGGGATVTLGGAASATVTADASGNYTFNGLANGSYTVTPAKTGYAFTPSSQPVTISGANVANVNFTAAATESIFTTQTPAVTNASDGAGVNYELGTVFTSDIAGQITAIRFWKASNESGTHTGHLWSATGQLLATVTFTNETASGWQQQNLTTPISITANTNYVVSVNTANTFYVATSGGLATSVVNGDLSTPVGNNGVYGSPGAFPSSSFHNANYFRDVVFTHP